MRRATIGIAFQLAAILYGFAAAPQAHADYRVCNGRNETINYAYTYWEPGCPNCGGNIGKYRDVGWYVISPGQCKSVWVGTLPDGYWYWTAFTASGAKWVGPWAWYVSNDAHANCECIGEGLGQTCSDVATCVKHPVWRGHREQYFINLGNLTLNLQ